MIASATAIAMHTKYSVSPTLRTRNSGRMFLARNGMTKITAAIDGTPSTAAAAVAAERSWARAYHEFAGVRKITVTHNARSIHTNK